MKKTIITPPLDTPSGWTSVSKITPMGHNDPIEKYLPWVVIGAGFTGLAAARRLAELNPDQPVVLLDARPVGWGASGRNSGFVIDLPHKFDLDTPEPDRLRKIIHLNRTAITDLEGLIKDHEIDCEWSRVGKLQGAVKERGTGLMRKFAHALEIVDEPHQMLDQQGCLDITGTNYYCGAIFTPGSALVNPLSLARGLAANLPANVLLRDDTAVLGMTSVEKGYELALETTDKQTYSTIARKVILAVDPFTPEFGYLKNRILPLLTFASITRPLTDSEKARFKGTMDWGLTPADAGGTTLRMTQDGRILLRNQYANAPKYKADKHMLADVEEKQREGFEKRYPDLAHIPFETTWGGVCGLSANHVSHFGEVAKGVYSASCYNGVGVAKGTISGKLLAEFACDYNSSELEDIQTISGLPSLIPPEPIRGIGVTTRLKFAEWQSKDEI